MTDPPTEPEASVGRIRRRRDALWRLVAACLVVLGLATVAGFLGRLSWFLELFSHFRVQYALSAASALVLFAIGRKWGWAVFAFALLAVNAATVAPLFYGRQAAPAVGLRMRVLFANLEYHNRQPDRFLALVSARDPDVIVLEEVTPPWLGPLQGLRKDYPSMSLDARDNALGFAFLSRIACPRSRMMPIGDRGRLVLIAELRPDRRRVRLVGAHPPRPVSPQDARERDTELAQLAEYVRGQSEPVILVGDLNCTPYSPYFRRLLRDSGLRDARRGFGIRATWPTLLGPLGLPIDHCLVAEGIGVTSFQVGPDIGSDHRPIIVDLVVP